MGLLRKELLDNFPKDYIKFADPVVEKICAENWGDGIGITYAQAARVKTLGNKFQGNTEITTFNEFQYFGCTYTNSNEFEGCTALNEITLPDIMTKISYRSFKDTAIRTIDTKNVVEFGGGTFQNCQSLISAKLSIDLTRDDALYSLFYNCQNLQTVELGKVTRIPQGFFYNCKSLTLPDGFFNEVLSVGANALQNCENVTGDLIMNNCTIINNNSFSNTGINSINLPKCTSCGNYAFLSCPALKSVNIPNIETISARLFYNCSELETVTLDREKVTVINQEGFRNCAKLKLEIDFPNVTSIRDDAFNGCENLYGSVNLPKLETLTTRAFQSSGIETIVDLGNLTTIGGWGAAFNLCLKLTYAILPEKFNNTNEYLFQSCTALRFVEFKCEDEMTLKLCFMRYCSALETLVMHTTTATATTESFFMQNVPNTCNIYVPDESVEQYKTALGWKTRASQIKPLSEYVPEE